MSCALRHRIPVVVAGASALNPFDSWTTAVAVDDSVVDAVSAPRQHRSNRWPPSHLQRCVSCSRTNPRSPRPRA